MRSEKSGQGWDKNNLEQFGSKNHLNKKTMFFIKTILTKTLLSLENFCYFTRYTVRGRGAKRRTSSVFSREISQDPCHVPRTSLQEHWFELESMPGYGLFWAITFLLTSCQKVTKLRLQKGSLNRPIPALKLFERCSLFGSFKIKSSNYQ